MSTSLNFPSIDSLAAENLDSGGSSGFPFGQVQKVIFDVLAGKVWGRTDYGDF